MPVLFSYNLRISFPTIQTQSIYGHLSDVNISTPLCRPIRSVQTADNLDTADSRYIQRLCKFLNQEGLPHVLS